MPAINERIHEIAVEYCPDYPDIENETELGKLWAIECTLKGTNEANNECHAMIKILAGKLGYSIDQVSEIWQKEITEKTNEKI